MALGWPFEIFDPKTSIAPAHFENLPSIAIRARAILHSRNSREIEIAAKIASIMLDDYYTDRETYTSIRSTPEDISIQNMGSRTPLQGPLAQSLAKEISEDFLELNLLENEVKYLKENINSYSFKHPDFIDPTQEELLCAFALWCIADCHSKLEAINILASSEFKTDLPDGTDPNSVAYALASAADLALLAMDAVCQAERILDLRDVFGKPESLVPRPSNEWDDLKKLIELTPDQIDKQSKKKTASMGGKARIEKCYPEKAVAIQYMLDNRKNFKTFPDAERAVTKALDLQDRDPRTVRGWLKPHWK